MCSTNIAVFQKSFGFTTTVLILLNAVPFLLGALIGAHSLPVRPLAPCQGHLTQ